MYPVINIFSCLSLLGNEDEKIGNQDSRYIDYRGQEMDPINVDLGNPCRAPPLPMFSRPRCYFFLVITNYLLGRKKCHKYYHYFPLDDTKLNIP